MIRLLHTGSRDESEDIMTRRQLRESIFKVLFRVEFNTKQEWEEQLDYFLEELVSPAEEEDQQEVADLDVAYIRQKVKDIYSRIEAIDTVISEHTEGWNLNRIGKAELAILRLGVYEIMYDEDVPQGVAINEAVELAKLYCAEDAKGFVNAVLAKFAKES
jgi:N utilization substance protein B